MRLENSQGSSECPSRARIGGIVATSLESIREVDPTTSILFLGSGFSLGANNIAGANPPNGSGLRRHFIDTLKLPADTNYDLQILTEEFANDDRQKLRDELYQIFRIASVDHAQTAVLDEPWRRIYTTNYDDIVEVHRQSKKQPRNDFDVSEPIPNRLPMAFRNSCQLDWETCLEAKRSPYSFGCSRSFVRSLSFQKTSRWYQGRKLYAYA